MTARMVDSPRLPRLERAACTPEQLRTAHAILSEVTGQTPKLLRLPNGDFDKLRRGDEVSYVTADSDTGPVAGRVRLR